VSSHCDIFTLAIVSSSDSLATLGSDLSKSEQAVLGLFTGSSQSLC
jgi:hypothetical protein